jgi:hypothetical protein
MAGSFWESASLKKRCTNSAREVFLLVSYCELKRGLLACGLAGSHLPHPASVLTHHSLSPLAAESLPELGHVGHHVVHAIRRVRMRIG